MPAFSEKLDDYLVRYFAYFNYKNYIDRMSLQGDEKILEIGSGSGNLSRFIARSIPNGRLYCIDNSNYWIEKTKNRLKFDNISFFKGVVEDFHVDDKRLDVIIIHYVLHDILEGKRKGTIKAMKNLLKKNGKIYIREPTRQSHGISPEKIKRVFSYCGFEEVYSKQNYSFPLRMIYEGIFQKIYNIN